MGKQEFDIEAQKHYPSQNEDPQLRWGFIRKVYSILTLQLLLTVLVASIVVVTPRINQFFHTRTGFLVYIIIAIFTMITKRGYDFNFLGPFLFVTLILVLLFSMIQIFFPMGSLVRMIISFVIALIYCGFIIYDTDNMIKRCSYDQYIMAAAMLYIDMIQLFIALLQILGFIDG
ncbi:Bax inhibitor 1-related protein [Cynara cardunculus var. scolymus]|uniref:Bax inhibitor 1-related protein n=1 Tax=Cynara cardunculus var. scolymus TaxID=59895 RepID=A0A103XEU1_CYNCS|nr:Bax inhibitor 1-related protein [Cynara cardunculus var. scolymus]